MSLSNQHPVPEDVPGTAASARGKLLAAPGNEPVSLWILTACGVVALIAGGILGGAGRLFDYQTTFRERYEREPAPGAAEQGPPPKEALAAYMAKGAKIYTGKCIACHGPEAKGDGANFPSLVGSKWATGETERFAMIILNGLQGPTSSGKSYPGAGMPSQSLPPTLLTPEDLAGVMTYVRNHFGNSTGDIVTVAMAKAALEIAAARPKTGQQITAEELTANHLKSLPGPALDPKAMVNPVTLAPTAPTAPTAPAAPATPSAGGRVNTADGL
jgi:mono/diheme cytochrome c family protein